jgi:uncharacterized membrane protein
MNADREITSYLDRLEHELADIPRGRRRELVAEIAEHIDAYRDENPDASEADLLNLLDRLGDPAEIAAEERERLGLRESRPGAREIAALVLLPIGGVVLPLVGWVVGVVLLWASDAWSSRDKLLGTLVTPGGLAVPFFLFLGAGFVPGESCSTVGGFDSAGRMIEEQTVCTGGPSQAATILGIVLFVAAVAAPIAMVVYLARRLRRPAPA